jgi:hypothetical protein
VTGVAIEILIGVATFMISTGASMFIAGARWGTMNTEVRAINDRLAKIEGMFTLRLKGTVDE